jgi:hypothetical protein
VVPRYLSHETVIQPQSMMMIGESYGHARLDTQRDYLERAAAAPQSPRLTVAAGGRSRRLVALAASTAGAVTERE